MIVGVRAQAIECAAGTSREQTPAESALQKGNTDKAATLYQQDLANKPNDPELTTGLARVLMRQQKYEDADVLLTAALQAHPNDAGLLTAKAELQMREGTPWLAGATASAAMKADPCVARLHLFLSGYDMLNSYFASAKRELETAHTLDPNDREIKLQWNFQKPFTEQIATSEKALDKATDAARKAQLQKNLDSLKKIELGSQKSCRLEGTVQSTELPLAEILENSARIHAFGLNIKLNNHPARLQIDTGAGGILVKRSVAQHAGLVSEMSQQGVGGIGDLKAAQVDVTYADTIQIGGLVFHDCTVHVIENSRMPDTDGLIGMNVLSQFLVSLDYPSHKLRLDPLPARPGEASASPSLNMGSDNMADNESDAVERLHDPYVAPEMKGYTHVYRVGHLLLLPVSMNKAPANLFVLDTGSMNTTVSPAAARAVTKVVKDSTVEVHGINGEVKDVYSAEKITFYFAGMSQTLEGIPSIDTTNVSRGIGMNLAGFLGIRTMLQTTLHIDYRDGLIKFDYNPKR